MLIIVDKNLFKVKNEALEKPFVIAQRQQKHVNA